MTEHVFSLLFEAAYLMGVGMFVVFLFLILLIGATNLIAWIISQYPEDYVNVSPKSSVKDKQGLSNDVVAAITAAVHQHRNK